MDSDKKRSIDDEAATGSEQAEKIAGGRDWVHDVLEDLFTDHDVSDLGLGKRSAQVEFGEVDRPIGAPSGLSQSIAGHLQGIELCAGESGHIPSDVLIHHGTNPVLLFDPTIEQHGNGVTNPVGNEPFGDPVHQAFRHSFDLRRGLKGE